VRLHQWLIIFVQPVFDILSPSPSFSDLCCPFECNIAVTICQNNFLPLLGLACLSFKVSKNPGRFARAQTWVLVCCHTQALTFLLTRFFRTPSMPTYFHAVKRKNWELWPAMHSALTNKKLGSRYYAEFGHSALKDVGRYTEPPPPNWGTLAVTLLSWGGRRGWPQDARTSPARRVTYVLPCHVKYGSSASKVCA